MPPPFIKHICKHIHIHHIDIDIYLLYKASFHPVPTAYSLWGVGGVLETIPADLGRLKRPNPLITISPLLMDLDEAIINN